MNEIKGFRGEYQFLSNFYTCEIIYEDLVFTSVEAAFQAAKCEDYADRLIFQKLAASEAKKAGRRVKLRADWEHVKIPIMSELVRLKFVGNSELLNKLAATGDATLVEANN